MKIRIRERGKRWPRSKERSLDWYIICVPLQHPSRTALSPLWSPYSTDKRPFCSLWFHYSTHMGSPQHPCVPLQHPSNNFRPLFVGHGRGNEDTFSVLGHRFLTNKQQTRMD